MYLVQTFEIVWLAVVIELISSNCVIELISSNCNMCRLIDYRSQWQLQVCKAKKMCVLGCMKFQNRDGR